MLVQRPAAVGDGVLDLRVGVTLSQHAEPPVLTGIPWVGLGLAKGQIVERRAVDGLRRGRAVHRQHKIVPIDVIIALVTLGVGDVAFVGHTVDIAVLTGPLGDVVGIIDTIRVAVRARRGWWGWGLVNGRCPCLQCVVVDTLA